MYMVIPQNYFIYISVFIGVIYLAMMYIGYKHGFLYELVALLYTAMALALAWFASPVLADLFPLFDITKLNQEYILLNQIFDLNRMLNTVSFFLILFLLLKLFYVILSLFLKTLNKIPVLGKFNQLLGAVLGVFNATLIVLALSMLLSTPVVKNGNDVREKTILKHIRSYSDQVLTYIVDRISDSNIKENKDEFEINAYREDFREWLIKVGKIDE